MNQLDAARAFSEREEGEFFCLPALALPAGNHYARGDPFLGNEGGGLQCL
jgi:hypothetical protein